MIEDRMVWILASAGVVLACIMGLFAYWRKEIVVTERTRGLVKHGRVVSVPAQNINIRLTWPHTIATTLGNGQPFIVIGRMEEGWDLEWVEYSQTGSGLVLRVMA